MRDLGLVRRYFGHPIDPVVMGVTDMAWYSNGNDRRLNGSKILENDVDTLRERVGRVRILKRLTGGE